MNKKLKILSLAFLLILTNISAQTTTVYSSGSGTFTVPANTYMLKIEVWGGGGNGSGSTNTAGGRGGGGGAYASKTFLNPTSGSNYSYTVGAAASDSYIGALASPTILAKGGTSATSTAVGTGGSAASSIGDVVFAGGNGATTGNSNGGGGGGSGSAFSAGGNASGSTRGYSTQGGGSGAAGYTSNETPTTGNGFTGGFPGGGGGGSRGNGNTGGSGGLGKIIFTVYLKTPDADGDGIPDYFDIDNDNDGIPDSIENASCTPPNMLSYTTFGYTGPARTNSNGNYTQTLTNGSWTASYSSAAGSAATADVNFNDSPALYSEPSKPFMTISVDIPGTLYSGDVLIKNNTAITGGLTNGIIYNFSVDMVTYDNTTPTGAKFSWVILDASGNIIQRIENYNTANGNGGNVSVPKSNVLSNYTKQFIFTGTTGNNYYLGITWTPNVSGANNVNDLVIDNIILKAPCDTDNDGTPNYLDLDSDNDGCLDAIEGDAAIPSSKLVNAAGSVSVGAGSTATKQNLANTTTIGTADNTINSQGLPQFTTLPTGYNASTGQTAGLAYDSSKKESATITKQPSSQTICLGSDPAAFSVEISTSPTGSPVTYQWYTRANTTDAWSIITGATSASYTPTKPTAKGTVYYYVSVSTACSTVSSNTVTLQTDNTVPGTATTTKSTVCKGDTQGQLKLTGYTGAIQWQVATSASGPWTDIDLAAARTDTYTPAIIQKTTYYRALVKDGVCAAIASNVITITVRYETDIAPTLQNSTNFVGGTTNIYTIPCSASTKTADLSGITASNTPDTNTSIAWYSSTGTLLTDVTKLNPGTYTAKFYDNTALGCVMTSSTQITVRTELCVNIPPVLTVYKGAQVIRNMATQINPTGGSGNYTYSIAANCSGVTIPAEGGNDFTTSLLANTTVPPTLGAGQSIVEYNAPNTPDDYSFCVTVCDVNGATQCKTVPIRVLVIDSPIFTCDQSLYLSRYDQASNTTNFVKLNYDSNGIKTTTFSLVENKKINALAFNPKDSYLYAVDNNAHLYRIQNLPLLKNSVPDPINGTDPNPAAVTDLNIITNLPVGVYNSGGFDADGFLYLLPETSPATGTSVMYKVNITDKTATTINLTESGSPVSISVNDISFDPTSGATTKVFYGYDVKGSTTTTQTGKLVSISTSGVVTHFGTDTALSVMGAMFTDALGRVYGLDRNNGYLYEFNKTDGTGKAFLIYDYNGLALDAIDGANCFTTILKFPLDVMVTKTAEPTTYVPGSNATFKIEVKNNSKVYAIQNLKIQDFWPSFITSANSTDFSYTKTISGTDNVYVPPFAQGTSVAESSPVTGGGLQETLSIPPQGTITYNLTVKMPSNFTGAYDNNVSLIIPNNYQDTDGTNNTASATVNSTLCYKIETLDPVNRLSAKHGITALQRAGEKQDNWPMERKGAWTVLESKTKGFVINRMPTAKTGTNIGEPVDAENSENGVILNPVKGMMFYDQTNNCLKINTDGTRTGWKCFNTQTCPTIN